MKSTCLHREIFFVGHHQGIVCGKCRAFWKRERKWYGSILKRAKTPLKHWKEWPRWIKELNRMK